MTRAIRNCRFTLNRVKPATAAKPRRPLSGIASDASGPVARELREKKLHEDRFAGAGGLVMTRAIRDCFTKIVSLAPEVL